MIQEPIISVVQDDLFRLEEEYIFNFSFNYENHYFDATLLIPEGYVNLEKLELILRGKSIKVEI